MNLKIFLDMDEVLADFVGSACRLWGVTESQLLTHWEPGRWDMTLPLSKMLGRKRQMPCEEFFSVISSRGQTWWEALPALPWALALIELIDEYDYEWKVVSTPSPCQHCVPGKQAWLRQRLGSHFNRYTFTADKPALAKKGIILIDDRQDTVEKFIAAGGLGIVFPRHHNCNYQYKSDPVSYVKQQLRELSHAS